MMHLNDRTSSRRTTLSDITTSLANWMDRLARPWSKTLRRQPTSALKPGSKLHLENLETREAPSNMMLAGQLPLAGAVALANHPMVQRLASDEETPAELSDLGATEHLSVLGDNGDESSKKSESSREKAVSEDVWSPLEEEDLFDSQQQDTGLGLGSLGDNSSLFSGQLGEVFSSSSRFLPGMNPEPVTDLSGGFGWSTPSLPGDMFSGSPGARMSAPAPVLSAAPAPSAPEVAAPAIQFALPPASPAPAAASRVEAGPSAPVGPTFTGPLVFQLQTGQEGAINRLSQLIQANGGSLEARPMPGLYAINGSSAALGQLMTQLNGDSSVLYAEQEVQASIALAPNDPQYTNNTLWGLNGTRGINAPRAWDVTTGSTKVIVGIVDTGIDYSHPDLYKNIWLNQAEIPNAVKSAITASAGWDIDSDGLITFWDLNDAKNQGVGKITDLNANGFIDAGDVLKTTAEGGWSDGVDADANGYVDDLVGWDWVNWDNNPLDDNNHGSHVAGTIGGVGNNGVGVAGINWKVQMMALKTFNSSGSGSTSNAGSAIRYAADHGSQLSNHSWSTSSASWSVSSAIEYAATKNHLVVAAAGNNGVNSDTTPYYPAAFANDNVLSVAAIDSAGNRASWSNYGLVNIDIGAPGVNIYSTLRNGGYGNMSGTSMATPHATGAAALLFAKNLNSTPVEVASQIKSTVTPLASLAGKTVTGGSLNVGAAVNQGAQPPLDVTGPRVTGATWSGPNAVSLDKVSLTFSEAIADGTFTAADVVTLSGPNGAIAVGSVVKVSSTVYEVRFASQGVGGTYTLTVGPDIRDLANNQMDQNQNGVLGESVNDRYTTTNQLVVDSTGARVTAATWSGATPGTMDKVSLTFSEAIADGTFSAADVVTLSGPNGAIAVGSVVKVSNTVYEVRFASQSSDGTYTLTVGPDIRDLANNQMDQNQNGINGESVNDRYTTTGALPPLGTRRFDFGTSTSPVQTGWTGVHENTTYSATRGFGWTLGSRQSRDRGTGTSLTRDFVFSNDATFAVDVANGTYQVKVTLGDMTGVHDNQGIFLEGVQMGSITTAAGQAITSTYTVTVSDGQLTLRIRDMGGMDANVCLIGLEMIPGTPPVDTTGPMVTGAQWSGATAGTLDKVTLTFSEALADGTFTAADVVTLSGPSGAIAVGSVVKISSTVYEVRFAAQSGPGTYALSVGPDIQDLAGNKMDQNQNGITGEIQSDTYTTSFNLQAPPPPPAPPAGSQKFDFGTSTSLVETGWTRVHENTTYSATQGFGWTSGSRQSRDRGTSGTSLTRDFVFSNDATFAVDVANGTYQVNVTLGDMTGVHDNQGIFLEGVQMGSITTAAGQAITSTYTVTVSDGQLTLRIRDMGGMDANVCLIGLEIARI